MDLRSFLLAFIVAVSVPSHASVSKIAMDCKDLDDGLYVNPMNRCGQAFFGCFFRRSFQFACPEGEALMMDTCVNVETIDECGGEIPENPQIPQRPQPQQPQVPQKPRPQRPQQPQVPQKPMPQRPQQPQVLQKPMPQRPQKPQRPEQDPQMPKRRPSYRPRPTQLPEEEPQRPQKPSFPRPRPQQQEPQPTKRPRPSYRPKPRPQQPQEPVPTMRPVPQKPQGPKRPRYRSPKTQLPRDPKRPSYRPRPTQLPEEEPQRPQKPMPQRPQKPQRPEQDPQLPKRRPSYRPQPTQLPAEEPQLPRKPSYRPQPTPQDQAAPKRPQLPKTPSYGSGSGSKGIIEAPTSALGVDCSKNFDGQYPASEGCSQSFVSCVGGNAYETVCPGGENMAYDETTERCLEKEYVAACDGQPTPIPPPTVKSETENKPDGFDCGYLEDGDYENPKLSCSEVYYSCSGGRATKRWCSMFPNIYYDKVSGQCHDPAYVPSCGGISTTTPPPPPPSEAPDFGVDCFGLEDGQYPDGRYSCSKYFVSCSNMIPTPMECPENTRFDDVSDRCLSPAYVSECGGTYTVPPPPVTPSPPADIGFDCSARDDGDYAIESCSSFYASCSGGVARGMQCAESYLRFDESSGHCLSPGKVMGCPRPGSPSKKGGVAY